MVSRERRNRGHGEFTATGWTPCRGQVLRPSTASMFILAAGPTPLLRTPGLLGVRATDPTGLCGWLPSPPLPVQDRPP